MDLKTKINRIFGVILQLLKTSIFIGPYDLWLLLLSGLRVLFVFRSPIIRVLSGGNIQKSCSACSMMLAGKYCILIAEHHTHRNPLTAFLMVIMGSGIASGRNRTMTTKLPNN